MNYIGIDIGSTCAKTVVLNEKKEFIQEFVQPTGWSSVDTAEEILQKLKLAGINLSDDPSCCVQPVTDASLFLMQIRLLQRSHAMHLVLYIYFTSQT